MLNIDSDKGNGTAFLRFEFAKRLKTWGTERVLTMAVSVCYNKNVKKVSP